jgi:hemoglobin
MSKYRTPYEALGDEGIQSLCNAFYDIMDSNPEFRALRKMHAADLSPMKEKLCDYLTGWMGGPPKYLEKHGTVCMTEPHANFWIGPEERDQWVACMDLALDEIKADDDLKAMLKQPIYRVADAVRNRDSSKTVDPNVIASG